MIQRKKLILICVVFSMVVSMLQVRSINVNATDNSDNSILYSEDLVEEITAEETAETIGTAISTDANSVNLLDGAVWEKYYESWEYTDALILNSTFETIDNGFTTNITTTGWQRKWEHTCLEDGVVVDSGWADEPNQLRASTIVMVDAGSVCRFSFTVKNDMLSEAGEPTEKNILVTVDSGISGDTDSTLLMTTVRVPAGETKNFEYDIMIPDDYAQSTIEIEFAYGTFAYSYAVEQAGRTEELLHLSQYLLAPGTTENLCAKGVLTFSDIELITNKTEVEIPTTEANTPVIKKSTNSVLAEEGEPVVLQPIFYDDNDELIDLSQGEYICKWYYVNDGDDTQEETYLETGLVHRIEAVSNDDFFENGGRYICRLYGQNEDCLARCTVSVRLFETKDKTIYADSGDSVKLLPVLYDKNGIVDNVDIMDMISFEWNVGDNQYRVKNDSCVISSLISCNVELYCYVYYGDRQVSTIEYSILPTELKPDRIVIDGFQVNTHMNGLRTIYSYDFEEETVVECGLLYGLGGCMETEEMLIGSTSEYVERFISTENGIMYPSCMDSTTARSYNTTMKFVDHGVAEEFTQVYYVRAYAILEDGTVEYSEIDSYTPYQIAHYLYSNQMMTTQVSFDFLYDNILSVVNPAYIKKEFGWSTIVKPDRN